MMVYKTTAYRFKVFHVFHKLYLRPDSRSVYLLTSVVSIGTPEE